jgi:hypothetical protein
VDLARPANIIERPAETSAFSRQLSKLSPRPKQGLLAPQATQIISPEHRLEKRQDNFVSTVTITATILLTFTTTSVLTSSIGAQTTTTVYITNLQTVQSLIDANITRTLTSTTTVFPFSGSSGGGSESIDTKGLGKGAKAGIGAGVGGGVIIVSIMLVFLYRRGRKSRKRENQEMIDNAVTSAIAAQRALDEPNKQVPVSTSPDYYHHGRMELSGAGIGSHVLHSPESELDGNPIQLFEMQQSRSPPPMEPEPYDDVPSSDQYPDVPVPRPYIEPSRPRE